MRNVTLAGGYGLFSGALCAVALYGMTALSEALWSGEDPRWKVFIIILAGGTLIALIRVQSEGVDLKAQLQQAHDPLRIRKKQTLFLALTAIIAVGFGGAVGPEAGLLAVVAEMSAIVAHHIARNHDEARLIGQTGAAAALSGYYGSPPGAVVFEDENKPPQALMFLAALAGLIGFILIARLLFEGGFHRLQLPQYEPAGDGSDVLLAFFPATLGALAGVLFLRAMPIAKAMFARVGSPAVQTLVGTLCLATLATALPILRFSGHHEFDAMLEWAHSAGWLALLLLGLLKVVALVICLSAGWRGGAIFPLIFAGAAMGGAAVAIIPGLDPTVGFVAGMGAATVLGLGKPVAATLVLMVLVGTDALGPFEPPPVYRRLITSCHATISNVSNCA